MANSEHQPDRLKQPIALFSLILITLVVMAVLSVRSGQIGSERFSIEWLDIEGELSRTSSSQIRAAAAPLASQGFFAVDLARVRAEVESLPWVAQAEVGRQWPDALHIRVVEHRPVARWNDDRLLSDQGEVFAVTGAEGMQGLTRLYGPELRRQDVVDSWLVMRRRLSGTGLEISQVVLDERGAWLVGLDNGLQLVLGREQWDLRLERFVAVHEQLQRDSRRAVRVDMRYTNGLAVRWAESEPGERDRHG